MNRQPSTAIVQVHDAGLARVLEAAMDIIAATPGDARPARKPHVEPGSARLSNESHVEPGWCTLAVVLETAGSTYARAGGSVLFSADRHVGWLSGGCLEPELQRRACVAATTSRLDWLDIDTRDDSALFSGSAVGCRGHQYIALVPLAAVPGCAEVFAAWLDGRGPLQLMLGIDGAVRFSCATQVAACLLATEPPAWPAGRRQWTLEWTPPPRALLLGAGPEAAPLVAHLQGLGWQVRVLEPRTAWRARCPVKAEDALSEDVLSGTPVPDAVLVMHHNFELDLDALVRLTTTTTPFIGLLGPTRRREDLFLLLSQPQRESLAVRLHSPVGLQLGGRGPEAIALSIAAELQAWLHDPSLRRT